MTSFSLKDLEFVIGNIAGAGANGDYTPPSMQWYGSRVLYIPKGVYYKAGPRANQQYMDLDNAADYWVVEEPLFFNIDDSTFNGTTGSGFLPGGKQVGTWYGVWLVDVGGEPSPLLLPFSPIRNVTNPTGITTVGVNNLTSVSGVVDGYRVLSFSNYLWEITDQRLRNILSYVLPPESLDGASNPSTNYATPPMTANNAPAPYVANASSLYSAGYEYYRAFNRSTGDFWHSVSGLPQWLSIDLGFPKLINKYKIACRSGDHIPYDWLFQGSNDNSSWVTLQSVTDATYGGDLWNPSFYTFTATTAYRYYRFYVTRTSSTYVNISEVLLVEDPRFCSYIETEGGQASPFPGRWSPSWCVGEGSSWFFGGRDQADTDYNDLWRFDTDTEQFFKISTTGGPPTGVHRAGMCYDPTLNAVFIFCGWASAGVTYQVWKCTLGSDNTGVWEQLTPGGTNPGPRSLDMAYCYDPTRRRFWCYGGWTTAVQDDLFYYDVPSNTWTRQCDGCPPGARTGCALIYDPVNDALMLYAGGSTNDASSLISTNMMYKFTISTSSWSVVTLSNPQPRPRTWQSSCYNDGYWYFVGGYTERGEDAFWRFKISDSVFEELPRYNASTIRGVGMSTASGVVYSFHGYDDWSKNRSVENWKFLVEANEWRRLDKTAELSTSSQLLLCPPKSMPSLYLGCVYIDSGGGMRQFLKDGWSYTWYDQGSSNEYRVQGYWGTGFGNTSIQSVVPPSAYEVKLGITGGSTSAMNNFRVGLCGNDAGGSLAAGFDCPLSNDRVNDNYRQTVNLCLCWYNEYASGSQRYGQTIDYMLSVNQLIRNHFWGHNVTPTAGHFTIAGFLE